MSFWVDVDSKEGVDICVNATSRCENALVVVPPGVVRLRVAAIASAIAASTAAAAITIESTCAKKKKRNKISNE